VQSPAQDPSVKSYREDPAADSQSAVEEFLFFPAFGSMTAPIGIQFAPDGKTILSSSGIIETGSHAVSMWHRPSDSAISPFPDWTSEMTRLPEQAERNAYGGVESLKDAIGE
jgi:hypothetical protein